MRGPTLIVGATDMEVVEVGIEATSVSPTQVALARVTTAGTTGTALDELVWGGNPSAVAVASQAPSTNHTLAAGYYRIANLPVAIGAGIIWTFGPRGLQFAGGTGDGIALILPGGSDVAINWYFDWLE